MAASQFQEGRDTAEEIRTILKDFEAGSRDAEAVAEAVGKLEKLGARDDALSCLDTVLTTEPAHQELLCHKARLLVQTGNPLQALDALAPLTAAGRGGNGAIVAQRADILSRLGRSDEAVEELEACLAQAPDNQKALIGLIGIFQKQGDPVAAQAVMSRALEIFPDATRLHIQKVQLIRTLQGREAALAAAEALAERLTDHPGVYLLLADLQEENNLPDLARATLARAIEAFPEHRAAWIILIRHDYQRRDYLAALENARCALAVVPNDPAIELLHSNCLAALGQHDAALAQLESHLRKGRFGPQIFIRMIELAVVLKEPDKAAHIARLALERFPDNPVLLENLAKRSALCCETVEDAKLEALLANKLPTALGTHLQLYRQMVNQDFVGALRGLRQVQSYPPDAGIAQQIAQVLFRAGRLQLAWRYLRACLRRWPADRRFDNLFVRVSSKAGWDADALAILEPLGGSVKHAPLMELYSGAGATGAALEHYWMAREVGEIPSATAVNLLFRNLLADGQAGDARRVARDYHAACKPSQRHFRTTLVGQFMIEAEIELQQEESALNHRLDLGDVAGHTRLMQNFPRSNVAAMRYLRHWRHHTPVVPASAEPIPRIIHQYWNDPTPPQDVSDMINSWRAAEGFEHRLYNRRQALDMLRREFGPRWVTAMLMAGNAAEEADFMRLCLLATNGGVYADADDVLTGRLTDLTDRGPGLIVYAEEGGGTVLGNNFLVARPRHPAIMLAARMARQILLSRSKDSTWFKTGPAMFTRAVARYLARCVAQDEVADVAILGLRELTNSVGLHNEGAYKLRGGGWRVPTNVAMAERIGAVLREFAAQREMAVLEE